MQLIEIIFQKKSCNNRRVFIKLTNKYAKKSMNSLKITGIQNKSYNRMGKEYMKTGELTFGYCCDSPLNFFPLYLKTSQYIRWNKTIEI